MEIRTQAALLIQRAWFVSREGRELDLNTEQYLRFLAHHLKDSIGVWKEYRREHLVEQTEVNTDMDSMVTSLFNNNMRSQNAGNRLSNLTSTMESRQTQMQEKQEATEKELILLNTKLTALRSYLEKQL